MQQMSSSLKTFYQNSLNNKVIKDEKLLNIGLGVGKEEERPKGNSDLLDVLNK